MKKLQMISYFVHIITVTEIQALVHVFGLNFKFSVENREEQTIFNVLFVE